MLRDCVAAGVEVVTVGQYLAAGARLPARRALLDAQGVRPARGGGRGDEAAPHRRALRALVVSRRRAPLNPWPHAPGPPCGRLWGGMNESRRPRRQSPRARHHPRARRTLPLPTPRCVILDVDRTLMKPGEVFSAEGYVAMGERCGLALDPARWLEGQAAALAAYRDELPRQRAAARRRRLRPLRRDRRQGDGRPGADARAVKECTARRPRGLEQLRELRPLHRRRALPRTPARGRPARRAALEHQPRPRGHRRPFRPAPVHHRHGLERPGRARETFAAHLRRRARRSRRDAGETVMVGDSYEEDVRGALAAGLGAILLDRGGGAPHHDDCPVISITPRVAAGCWGLAGQRGAAAGRTSATSSSAPGRRGCAPAEVDRAVAGGDGRVLAVGKGPQALARASAQPVGLAPQVEKYTTPSSTVGASRDASRRELGAVCRF